MQPVAIVLASVLVASGAAAGVSVAMRPPDAPSLEPRVVELQQELGKLRGELQALQQDLAAARAAVAAAPVSAADASGRRSAAVTDEQVQAAVAAWFARRDGAPAGGAGVASATGDAAAATFDLERDFGALVGTNFWNAGEAWKKAFAAGRMDAVIAKFEELAAAAPNDPKAQMDLASAYMAYLQMDSSRWQLSGKADQVYDRVLALDDHHWEARFSKAVSYTFYPDFLGKKKDAIAHFQTLVQQQETMPVEASQAQTYLYLGNLLEARDPEQARQMWARGAQRHPDNQDLKKRLAGQ